MVGPTNRYGEFIVVYDKWDKNLIRRSEGPVGIMIWVDDATIETHDDQLTLPVAVARGDRVFTVIGPLAYTFDNYKIAPTEMPRFEYVLTALPKLPATGDNQFSIATFNVENLFDSQLPHPNSQQLPSKRDYQRDLHRTAEAVVAMGAPTILALQEVENLNVLKELVDQPSLRAYDYRPVLQEGHDSRGIDSGYLVRGDRATIDDFDSYDAPGSLFSRPHLGLVSTIHLASGDQQIVLLNNHFLSLSAGEVQTEPVRDDQAAWNAKLLEELQADYPQAEIIVLGDLNSFYNSKPLETLQSAGLRHVYESISLDNDLPYTYIFDGAAQTMDHLLVTQRLFDQLVKVNTLQINADFPPAHPMDMSPIRMSDHDPLVALFEAKNE